MASTRLTLLAKGSKGVGYVVLNALAKKVPNAEMLTSGHGDASGPSASRISLWYDQAKGRSGSHAAQAKLLFAANTFAANTTNKSLRRFRHWAREYPQNPPMNEKQLRRQTIAYPISGKLFSPLSAIRTKRCYLDSPHTTHFSLQLVNKQEKQTIFKISVVNFEIYSLDINRGSDDIFHFLHGDDNERFVSNSITL